MHSKVTRSITPQGNPHILETLFSFVLNSRLHTNERKACEKINHVKKVPPAYRLLIVVYSIVVYSIVYIFQH